MKLFKKVMYLCMFLIGILFIGCNSQKLPASKPKDFNFVFNYGVGAKNQLDTIKGQYTKDMVIEPSITTNLKLSDQEMNTIYSQMRKINILDYPEDFEPKNDKMVTTFYTYHIKIIADGKDKKISWEDKSLSKSRKSVKLRELFKKIQEIIVSKEEFKKLPKAKGGYQ